MKQQSLVKKQYVKLENVNVKLIGLACLLTQHKPAKQSIHYDSKDSQLPVHYSRMMNSENASNNIVQSLIDLVNMAKWLMDENQHPSVTEELGRLFPSIRGSERRGESSELCRVGAAESSALATDTNNASFAIRSTTKWTIEEIWGSKATSKMCYLFHVISQV